MKVNRLKEKTRDNASKGHNVVLELLREMFPGYVIYQEYPYSKILEYGYKKHEVAKEHQNSVYLKRGNRLFADIYIKNLDIIIEVNGEFHYKSIVYGKKDTAENAIQRFEAQKNNDYLKRQIANEALMRFIEIPYWDLKRIDKNYIWSRLEI